MKDVVAFRDKQETLLARKERDFCSEDSTFLITDCAWTAAFSDAVGFLILQQLGASYMSGNSMVTGVALGQENWTSVLNHGLPILSFVGGLTLGILVIMQARYWGLRFPFAVVFSLEVICLLACLLIGNSSLQKGIS